MPDINVTITPPERIGNGRCAALAPVLLVLIICATVALAGVASTSPSQFSIVIIPDTQVYADVPELRHAITDMTTWIATEATTRNIRAVFQLGDLVEHGDDWPDADDEWAAVDVGIDVLDAAGLPYLLAVGNHDYDQNWNLLGLYDADRGTAKYDSLFGPSRHMDHTWWNGGAFQMGSAANSYITMDIGGSDYLFMALEFGPRSAVISWADTVLSDHSDKIAFIVTHSYVYQDGTLVSTGDQFNPHAFPEAGVDTHDGEELYQGLLRHHGNIAAVFNGHHVYGVPYSVARRSDPGDAGNTIHGLLFNMQDQPAGGGGYLRVLTVDPVSDTLAVETYSSIADAYLTGDDHQFTLPLDVVLSDPSPASATATVAVIPTAAPTLAPPSSPAEAPTLPVVDPVHALATAESMARALDLFLSDYLTRAPTLAPASTPTPEYVMTTIIIQPDATAGKDALISSAQALFNYGTNGNISVGDLNSAVDVRRSLIQFDLSPIPVNATIISATLSLYANLDRSSNARTFRVFRMLRSWTEGTGNATVSGDGATWNTYNGVNSWTTAGAFGAADCEQTDIGSRVFTATETVPEFKDFVLTASSVQQWVSGTLTNNGMLIKADTESDDEYRFTSSDDATASNRPRLTIVYTVPSNTPAQLHATMQRKMGRR